MLKTSLPKPRTPTVKRKNVMRGPCKKKLYHHLWAAGWNVSPTTASGSLIPESLQCSCTTEKNIYGLSNPRGIPSRLFSLLHPEQEYTVASSDTKTTSRSTWTKPSTWHQHPDYTCWEICSRLSHFYFSDWLWNRSVLWRPNIALTITWSEKNNQLYTLRLYHILLGSLSSVFCFQGQFISKLGENKASSLYQMIFLVKHYFQRTTWQLPCFDLDISKLHKCLKLNSVCSGTWLHAVFTSCAEYNVETVHRKKCCNL